MAKTDIVTGQYVRISQTAASVGDRIVARLIDYGVLGLYSLGMLALIGSVGDSVGDGLLMPLAMLFFILPTVFYSFWCELLFHGQTLGKRIRHTRVVAIDGSQPSVGQAFMRWMFLLADVWFSCAGIIPIIVSRRHQRFGDMAAGTMVIREDEYERWHSALDDFYWLTPGYKPLYPQAERLSDGQARIIDRTLYAPGGYEPEQVARLAAKVAAFLKITPQEDAPAFLARVLHDYQYYTLDV